MQVRQRDSAGGPRADGGGEERVRAPAPCAPSPPPLSPSIYTEIGVAAIINGRGATTAVGGTLMHPAVLAAMVDAGNAFVVLDELNQRVGERVAVLTGM